MTALTYTSPTVGSFNSVADPQIATALSQILTWSTNIDGTNLTAAAAQSAGVNQAGQTVKGAVNIATSQSTSSTTYTTLATPDQITGLVVPTNGIIRVWYQALWQESVGNAGRAAIFIGANQLQQRGKTLGGTVGDSVGPVAAMTVNGAAGGIFTPLASCTAGVGGANWGPSLGATADVATGMCWGDAAEPRAVFDMTSGLDVAAHWGACDIRGLSAGTYTVSIQFKASSGSVTAQNRLLAAEVRSFA